jgi:hypothetical protein
MDMPLWDNPLLCLESKDSWDGARRRHLSHLRAVPGLLSVGSLVTMIVRLEHYAPRPGGWSAATADAFAERLVPGIPGLRGLEEGLIRLLAASPQEMLAYLQALSNSLPPGWVWAAHRALPFKYTSPFEGYPQYTPAPGRMADVLLDWDQRWLQTWGWRRDDQGQPTLPLIPPPGHAPFKVRHATAALTALPGGPGPAVQAALADTVAAALSLGPPDLAPPAPVEQLVERLSKRLNAVWGIRWENSHKETWWRLLLQGVPGAGGHGIVLAGGCGCGAAAPARTPAGALEARAHAFWHCPVAQGVRRFLEHNLPAGTVLRPWHLWLLEPPSQALHPGVWHVVALAALEAMFRGMGCLWRHCMARDERLSQEAAEREANGGLRQLTLEEAFGLPVAGPAPAPPPDPVSLVARRAMLATAAALEDFVGLQRVPRGWLTGTPPVGSVHPFIGVAAPAAGEGGRTRLCLTCRVPGAPA